MKRSKAFGISLLWLLLFAGVQIVLSIAASVTSIAANGLSDIEELSAGTVPAVLVLANVITPLLAIMIVKIGGNKLSASLGIKKISLTGIVVSVVFAAALAPVISWLLELIPIPESIMEFYDDLMDMAIVPDNKLSLLATVLLAPVCEEMIFRGAIFHTLDKAFSTASSVLITAFLFGLIHLNPVQSTYAFVLGIVLNLVCIRFNSLWASILCHICFNLIGGYFDYTKYGDNVQLILLIACGAVALSLGIWMLSTRRSYSKRR